MGCAGTPSPRRPAPSHRSPLNAIKTQNPQTQNSTVPTGGGLRAPDPTSSRTPGSRNLTPDLIGFSKEWEVSKVGCDGSFLGSGDLELLSGSPPHLHRAFRAPWYAGHSCQGPESSRDPEARPLAGPFLGRPTQVAGDGYLPVRLATAPRSSFSSSLPTRLPRPSDHPSGAGIRQITSPVDLRGEGHAPEPPCRAALDTPCVHSTPASWSSAFRHTIIRSVTSLPICPALPAFAGSKLQVLASGPCHQTARSRHGPA